MVGAQSNDGQQAFWGNGLKLLQSGTDAPTAFNPMVVQTFMPIKFFSCFA
jgi:hypothetical protein